MMSLSSPAQDESEAYSLADPETFPPLESENSIRFCYGSPSIRKASLKLLSHPGDIPLLPKESISNRLRWTTNIAALASAFFFSGIIFGWAPLKLILHREGQYADMCLDGVDTCAARMGQFNLIFTISQFLLSFASLPVGFFLDHASKAVHYGIAACLICGGLFLFGISDSDGPDFFLLSYSLLALGGCMSILGAFPASFLLPEHQAGILAGVSCLFDASSVIFAIFSRLNVLDDAVFSRQNLFLAYSFLSLLLYFTISYCWGKLERKNWKEVVEEERKDRLETQSDDGVSTESLESADPHKERVRELGLHDQSLTEQLQTFDFFFVLSFAGIHMLRCNFYIETVNEIMRSIGDDDATYANIFSFVLPSGVLFVPAIEATIRKYGIVSTLKFTNVLGVLFGVLLLIPSLYVQAINFAVFACFRAYLYATISTFVAITFGVRTMGRVVGMTFTCAALVTLFQYPLANMAEGRHNNEFTTVNFIMLSICTVPIALSWMYSRSLKQEAPLGERQPLMSSLASSTRKPGNA